MHTVKQVFNQNNNLKIQSKTAVDYAIEQALTRERDRNRIYSVARPLSIIAVKKYNSSNLCDESTLVLYSYV